MTEEILLENFNVAVAAFDIGTAQSVDLTGAFEFEFSWLVVDL